MKFNYQTFVPFRTPSADEVAVHELGGNPLSAIMINLQPLNDTGTLANFEDFLGLCKAFNRITVLHRGHSIFAMRGEDAAALAFFRHGILPWQGQLDNTNNERRQLMLPILLGRAFLHPTSCFPETKRGSLVIELDIDIADTGYDTFKYSVDCVEILDAKPKEFERKVQLTKTFAATGLNDVDLPMGNIIRGALLWGTTGYAGASPAPSWGALKVLVDNQEEGYSNIRFESLQSIYNMWGRQPPGVNGHRHIVTTDGNAQTELATLAGVYNPGDNWSNYAWMEYDPTGDDMFALDLTKANAAKIRANAETADAVRCIPVERILV